MLKKMAILLMLLIPQYFYAKENQNSNPQNIIIKLAEIDSKIDEMIIKENFDPNQINILEIKSELERIFLNSKKIDHKEARLIWMYSGKIYKKINKFFNQNSKSFRLSPSDTSNNTTDISKDAKKTFSISKWLYLVSKESKKSQ